MSIHNIKAYTKISNLQYEFKGINFKNYIIENSNKISIIKLKKIINIQIGRYSFNIML